MLFLAEIQAGSGIWAPSTCPRARTFKLRCVGGLKRSVTVEDGRFEGLMAFRRAF